VIYVCFTPESNSSTAASIRFHIPCPSMSPASNSSSARMAAWIGASFQKSSAAMAKFKFWPPEVSLY